MKKPKVNLSAKYPWIQKWGQWMGSYQYYIDQQLELAEETNAPLNATSYNEETKHWTTTDDIKQASMRFNLGLPPIE